MLEVKLNVAAPDVRCHGNDRSGISPSNDAASRYTIQIRHDDIHQDQIKLLAFRQFVHCLQSVELQKVIRRVLVIKSGRVHTAVSTAQQND